MDLGLQRRAVSLLRQHDGRTEADAERDLRRHPLHLHMVAAMRTLRRVRLVAAAACAGCHGEGGISTTASTPSLVGLDPKYFVMATNAYKNGQRKNETMKAMAATLSDADLNTVALYYALQKPARAKTPSPGDQ